MPAPSLTCLHFSHIPAPLQAPDGATVNPLTATPYAAHIDRPQTPLSADVDAFDEDKGALQDSTVDKPDDGVSSNGGSSPLASEQGGDARLAGRRPDTQRR